MEASQVVGAYSPLFVLVPSVSLWCLSHRDTKNTEKILLRSFRKRCYGNKIVAKAM
jgi:hypothetical protein